MTAMENQCEVVNPRVGDSNGCLIGKNRRLLLDRSMSISMYYMFLKFECISSGCTQITSANTRNLPCESISERSCPSI